MLREKLSRKIWELTGWKKLSWFIYGHRWTPANEGVIRFCASLDIPESDVKDYRVVWNKDVVTIRLKNWRQIEVTGLQIYQYSYHYPRVVISGGRSRK